MGETPQSIKTANGEIAYYNGTFKEYLTPQQLKEKINFKTGLDEISKESTRRASIGLQETVDGVE